MISSGSSAKNTLYIKNVFISSLTNPSTKAMLVKYSSNAKATGYEISYSPYSTILGYKFYSSWSAVKSIKITK